MNKACASGKQPASPKKVNKMDKRLVGVLVLAGLVLLLGIGYIVAKYLANNEYRQNQLAPESFYFTVDMLGDTITQESLTGTFDIYGGEEKNLIFTVQNYFDDLRVNEDDVQYSVSILEDSDYDECSLIYGETLITESNRSQTIAGGAKVDHEYTLHVPNGYKDGDTVKVQVDSSKPYAKGMTLIFVLHDHKAPVSYRLEDRIGSNYATLYLMFNDDVNEGNMKVDWIGLSEELFVDTTSPYILDEDQTLTTNNPEKGTLTDAVITKDMEKDSSILVYFFKEDPSQDYSTLPLSEDLPADKEGSTYCVALGSSQLVDTSWYDDNKNTFILKDSGDLYGFARLVNAGNTFEGKTVKLGADIKLNSGNAENYKVNKPSYEWTPIGNANNRFEGNFDGDMHTITGLYINGTEQRMGLFGVTESATIKNLKLKNSYIASSGQSVGALIGHGGATFENVYVDAIVEGADAFTGGFVGRVEMSSSKFINCWFDGTVINTCGQGKNERGFVGGFVGYAINILEVEFRNCLFTGFIDISAMDVRGSAATGGFVGVAAQITLKMYNSVMLGGVKPGADVGYYAYLGGNDSLTAFIGENMYFADQAMNSECKEWGGIYAGSTVATFKNTELASRPKGLGRRAENNMENLDWVATWKSTAVGVPVLRVFEDERQSDTITERQGLYDFAFLVNDSEDFEGETIKLGANIVFNTGLASNYETQPPKYTWIRPIGWKEYVPFKGLFDGQGYTISGLYMNSTDDFNGLFGSTKDATVKNLKITNSYISTTKRWTGSIVARGSGTFENLYSDAILKTSNAFIGGIFGQLDNGQVENAEPGSENQDLVESSSMTNCWFDGTITSTSSGNQLGYIGGLVGYAAHEVHLINCLNTGHIDISGADNEAAGTGGLIGANARPVELQNCAMLGTIKAGADDGYYATIGKFEDANYAITGSNVYVVVSAPSAEYSSFQGARPESGVAGFAPITVTYANVLGNAAKSAMPKLDWVNTWQTIYEQTPILRWTQE